MLKIVCTALLAIIVFFIAVMIFDCNRFVIRRYDVGSDKVKKRCRYVLISDLHGKSYGRDNRKLTDAVDSLHPDGILMAGDIMTASPGADTGTALHLVRALHEKYPVYYGLGNHEYRAKLYPDTYGDVGTVYERKLLELGVAPLDNLRTESPEGIDICGITVDKAYFRKFKRHSMDASYVESLAGPARKDAFQILIAHNPQFFEAYADWGADLTVSGHVHGGVMRLPLLGGVVSPNFRIFPKYDGGMFERNGRKMIVSRGLGTHTLPIRIFNPGELIVIDIHP